nr:immunoglobulin heavy chain junction region [Mus musculus]MBK4186270.1 immunoglobulin heavy chain junction region [Mus musculus]
CAPLYSHYGPWFAYW